MSSQPPSSSPASPAPHSDKENSPRAVKRRRSDMNGNAPAAARRRVLDNGDGSEGDAYDPNQPIAERREVQRGFRSLMKDLTENRDEYLQANSEGLHRTLRQANRLAAGVKQTTEATIDSSLLVQTVHASVKKTTKLTAGNAAQGIDTEEFISKCITYMRLGSGIVENDAPELSSTQRQRRAPARRRPVDVNEDENEDEIGDDGDMLNWEHLGRFGCIPYIRRPAVPGFLLGPLSVEKKFRKVTKRTAPFRPDRLRETRPQVLNAEDVQRNEKNDLTAICHKVLKRLIAVQQEAQDRAEAVWENGGEEAAFRIMKEYGLRDTGGIDLFRFVVNPRSFGQTVENLFYISFLIRDGKIAIEFDENGLPSLVPQNGEESGTAKQGAQRHQAVLSIDFDTWQQIIDEFEIKESLIEHRAEQSTQGPGARGWYS